MTGLLRVPDAPDHCFPWDGDITPAKVSRWLEEIAAQGIVPLYRSWAARTGRSGIGAAISASTGRREHAAFVS